MPLIDVGYCSKRINVPPRLPLILKQFCKAAIRTQPYDLLKWSSAYFQALAEGTEPPTKIRLEYPLPGIVSGLTLGFLKVLLRQFGDYNKILPVEIILRRWDDLCLDRRDLNLIMMIGRFRRKFQVKNFLAIAVGLLGSSLYDTMLMICELFTLEPDGGSAMIPVGLFMELYGYLAALECDSEKSESIDEDPTDGLVIDSSDLSTPQPSGEFGEQVDQKAIALDSETDIELDVSSSKNEQIKSTSNEQIDSPQKVEPIDKIETPIMMEEKNTVESIENDSVCQAENIVSVSSSDILTHKGEANETHISSEVHPIHYPNIPGIGPRLLPEEVTNVAIWMSECARLQGGMVGPRNLRHFQCPPLDRHRSTFS